MGETPTIPESFTASGGSHMPVTRTQPGSLLRHDISDEELTMLSQGKRDGWWELGWATFALAVGAAPSAGPALYSTFSGSLEPVSGSDMLQIIMFVVGLAFSILCFSVVRFRGGRANNLSEKIRARKPG
jgi:hypothetical protein